MSNPSQPIPYGQNADLDAFYAKLGEIEQLECDAIEFGRPDLLSEIRLSQIPLKREINKMEGMEIYEVPA